MDRNLDPWSLLRIIPGDWRKRLLDHAEEHTNGIHALDQTVADREYS